MYVGVKMADRLRRRPRPHLGGVFGVATAPKLSVVSCLDRATRF